MTAPNQPQPRQETPPRSGRIGGLPTWGWVAIAAAGGVVVLLWLRSRKTAAPTTPTTDTSGNDIASELSVLQTEIQNLQGMGSLPTSPPPAGTPSSGPPLTAIQPIPGPNIPPGTMRPLGYTTVSDAKNLNELLSFYGETQQQFEQDNPWVKAFYATYIPSRGYVAQGTPGGQIVINAGRPGAPRPFNVRVPGGWGSAS